MIRTRSLFKCFSCSVNIRRNKVNNSSNYPPTKCDVAIIGGGIMGASTAFWLKRTHGADINVVVFEKDPTYSTCSTTLSVGGIRQQFSLEENIQIALCGWHFIQDIDEYLGIDGEKVDVNFRQNGYLTLASEENAKAFENLYRFQRKFGSYSALLNTKQLKEKFPWMNTDGIALGIHGLSMEGWFDPWSMLAAFKKKARSLGAQFVDSEVIAIQQKHDVQQTEGKLHSIEVKLNKTNEKVSVNCDKLVLAAGAWSGHLARLAGIGTGKGILSVELPIEHRKRYVYHVTCPNGPPQSTSLVLDPWGSYFRPEGVGYLCGKSPLPSQEPSTENLDVDYDFFQNEIWPRLAQLVPAFESLKIKNAWGGFYDFNYFDENGVIGQHPYFKNLYIASGFSGHGIQQGPAIGRIISQMISGEKPFLDLSRLSFDRLVKKTPLLEGQCY